MKIAALVLLIVAPMLVLGQSSDPAAACGAAGVSFEIKLDHAHQTVELPQPGKAQVYFIQDTGVKVTFGVYPTTLIGIDGAWVGAYKNDSFFSIEVDPGEHHFCSNMDSISTGHQRQLAHFTAEPGKTYYFRTRLLLAQGLIYPELNPIDSDEGRYLVASYPLSISHPKK